MGKQKSSRRHRAAYPTPGFYFFAFLLNMVALILDALFLNNNRASIVLLSFGIVALVGVLLSVYSVTVKPLEANKKIRKILCAFVAIYGFVVLAAIGATIILTPILFVSP